MSWCRDIYCDDRAGHVGRSSICARADAMRFRCALVTPWAKLDLAKKPPFNPAIAYPAAEQATEYAPMPGNSHLALAASRRKPTGRRGRGEQGNVSCAG